MKKLMLLIFCCQIVAATAQKNAPKWLEKQRKAIVSITTYNKDNAVLRSGTGFFINESGEALSAYTLFKGANRATVKDTDGKVYEVTHIIGADEFYDVIKFRVDVPKKITWFNLAVEPLAEGATAYLVPFVEGKKGTFREGKITEVSNVKESYGYYKVDIPMDADQEDAPLLTASGEVFGLAQEDATGSKEHLYAISARFANSLNIATMDALNTTYSTIGIRKAWPTNEDDAQIALMLMSGSQDVPTYLETLNDYISNFPKSTDGYQRRASTYALNRAVFADSAESDRQIPFLDKAKSDIETYLNLSPNKADALFNKAQLVYEVAVTDTTLTDPYWSVSAAEAAVREAIITADMPVYHQLLADMLLNSGNYEEAYAEYEIVNNSEIASAASYYWSAKAKENIKGANLFEVLSLLDSAVVKTGLQLTNETLGYLTERIEFRKKLMLYEDAVKDYDIYYNLLQGRVNDAFYYQREQTKFRAGDMDGALADIQAAIRLNPNDPSYLAEEASVYIRQEKYDDAQASLQKAIAMAPDFAACYRLSGLCYVRQQQQSKACDAFQKANELGDPVVERLISEHCK